MMCKEKIEVSFSGKLNTNLIAKITALFGSYRINIQDIHMYTKAKTNDTLIIICDSSSTTDEIDSFWNDLNAFTTSSSISFSKKYLN